MAGFDVNRLIGKRALGEVSGIFDKIDKNNRVIFTHLGINRLSIPAKYIFAYT